MKQTLLFLSFLFSLTSAAQGELKPEIQKKFLTIDSTVAIIDSRKDLTQGFVDGTDESGNGFTWEAHFYWDRTSKQIHKLCYHGSDTHCVFYFSKSILIKIVLSDEEEFYRVDDHFLDISGRYIDAKIRDKVSIGIDISNSIRKKMR